MNLVNTLLVACPLGFLLPRRGPALASRRSAALVGLVVLLTVASVELMFSSRRPMTTGPAR
jgi:hypothetical protein